MPQTYTCVPAGVPPTTYTNNTQAGTPVLNYDIGFPYIQTTDILVFTGEEGNWTQRNQGTGADEYQINPQGGLATDEVVFNNGVGGANIMIWRRTDLCNMGRTFTAGSSIRAEDLNQDFTQLLYVLQETGTLIDGIVDGGTGGGGLPLPGDQIDLDDLGDVEITTPANPSWLRWNGTQWEDRPILEDGDTWVSDDEHIVTSEAGDDRWLGIPGGGGTTITGGSGIELTGTPASVVEVDLAETTPGLQFDANDDLQVIGNSVTQTGGTDVDPNITNGPSNIQITGGANVTVTRNSANQLTIAAAAATGGATFRGTVDVDNDNTLPGTTGQQNPNAVNVGDGFTVENNVAAASVTANWNTVLDNWDTPDGIINSGDVILCITAAAAGSPTNARYNLIRTGGNINNLQQVTDAGSNTNNSILLQDGTPVATTIRLNADGSAVFNERGVDADFRVASDTNANMLFVDADVNRVGIGTAAPTQALGVNGSIQTGSWNGTTGSGTTIGQTGTVAIRPATTGNANVVSIIPTDTGVLNTVFRADGSAHFNAANNDADFRVDGDTNDNPIFVDASTDRVGINTGTPGNTCEVAGGFEVSNGTNRQILLNNDGLAFFNEQQNDADFRVSSDNIQNMLFVDGGEDRVGINTGTPRTFLDVNGLVAIDQNAINAGAGNWNLNNGNFWTLGAVVVPNPTSMVAGISGLIVNTAQATWPDAGGDVFQYADNTPPNITAFPAVIPFYCTNNTTIFIGTPTVNIT
jgi:hypothetical protein